VTGFIEEMQNRNVNEIAPIASPPPAHIAGKILEQ
ncbi:MAG: hypothetical protein UZ07_CHB004000173, partial [Chlorobi bacterium OLB7]